MMLRNPLRCPRCGSSYARPVRRWRVGDYVPALVGRRPFACQMCRQRFRSRGAPTHADAELCGGNKLMTAQMLGISHRTLARWLSEGDACGP